MLPFSTRVQGPVVTHGSDTIHLYNVVYAPASRYVLSARAILMITMISVARVITKIYPHSQMNPFAAVTGQFSSLDRTHPDLIATNPSTSHTSSLPCSTQCSLTTHSRDMHT
jgi:hypothetical protein